METMKKYFNISTILGSILILGSSAGLVNIKRTGCASGYWGYGSCGIEAVVSSVVILVTGIGILYFSVQSVRSKNNLPNNEKRRF